MRKRLSLLIVMASIVISVFALNLGVALAHPPEAGFGTGNALTQLGVGSTNPDGTGNIGDPPAFSNEVAPNEGNGGLWGNPSTADATEYDDDGNVTTLATGQDAMASQWEHSPVCSAHLFPGFGIGPGHD